MSISTVPGEILEMIISNIHSKSSSPTAESQKIFCSLALTSKLFLPLARSHLYNAPLTPTGASWTKAKALHHTLTTTRHGELISSLKYIAEWVVRLESKAKSEPNLPFRLPGFSKAFSWYFAIVELCTLKTTGIFADSSHTLSRLLQALGNSSATLKNVIMVNPLRAQAGRRLITSQVLEALEHPHLRNVEKVAFSRVSTRGSPILKEPAIHLPLQDVVIRRGNRRLQDLCHFLPRNSSSLRCLEILIDNRTSEELVRILNYVPSTLKKLKFSEHRTAFESAPSLTTYLLPKNLPTIPITVFPFLPSLRTLHLPKCQGPSLALLEILLVRAPALEQLDFSRSFWISDNSINPLTSPNVFKDLVFPLEQVFTVLARFRHLKYVNLGYLPTGSSAPFVGLKGTSEKNGIEVVEWNVCRPLPRKSKARRI